MNVRTSCYSFGSIDIDQAVGDTIKKDTASPGGGKDSLHPAALKMHYMTAEYLSTFL